MSMRIGRIAARLCMSRSRSGYGHGAQMSTGLPLCIARAASRFSIVPASPCTACSGKSRAASIWRQAQHKCPTELAVFCQDSADHAHTLSSSPRPAHIWPSPAQTWPSPSPCWVGPPRLGRTQPRVGQIHVKHGGTRARARSRYSSAVVEPGLSTGQLHLTHLWLHLCPSVVNTSPTSAEPRSELHGATSKLVQPGPQFRRCQLYMRSRHECLPFRPVALILIWPNAWGAGVDLGLTWLVIWGGIAVHLASFCVGSSTWGRLSCCLGAFWGRLWG